MPAGCLRLAAISIHRINEIDFSYMPIYNKITIQANARYALRSCKGRCSGLTSVAIPGSVTSIGKRAFHGFPDLTFTVARDSYAEQYCKKKGLAYVYADGLD